MSVLVTGGAGYIGSHACARLNERGEELVVLDNLSGGHRPACPCSRFYQGDLRDALLLEKVFVENDIEAVIHLAGDIMAGESVEKPLKYYGNNVVSSLALLNTMIKFGVKNIIFSSSASVYGDPDRVPILESDPVCPNNPYGETKLAVEKALSWAARAYGLRYVALRYFNAAGAHPGGEIGEDHRPETHLVPILLKAALGRLQSVQIFGWDYNTPDGTCIRDYVHVDDLAWAHILGLDRLRVGGPSAVYNLGSGCGYSNLEVANMAREVAGVDIRVEVTGRRPGDPAVLVASPARAEAELGWKRRYSTLREIVETAWQWHCKYPDGYRGKGTHFS